LEKEKFQDPPLLFFMNFQKGDERKTPSEPLVEKLSALPRVRGEGGWNCKERRVGIRESLKIDSGLEVKGGVHSMTEEKGICVKKCRRIKKRRKKREVSSAARKGGENEMLRKNGAREKNCKRKKLGKKTMKKPMEETKNEVEKKP